MIKILILNLLFLIGNALAEDAKVPCLKNDGTIGLNVFQNYDCALIKKVTETPEIKKAHKNKINDKLADRLAFKIERNLEEIATLDQYFRSLESELELTKSENVLRECKLEVISNPCHKANPEKMKMLLSKLNMDGNNLQEKLYNIFSKSRGLKTENKMKCPLEAPSGYYTLNAQFDERVASELVKAFITQNRGPGTTNWLKDAYNRYPQLKLIKKASEGNPDFLPSFEIYLKNYKNEEGKDQSYKNYVLDFFVKNENQTKLAAGLASVCSGLKKDIQKFVCDEMPHLSMSEDVASKLFEEDADVEESVELSNAFSCSDLKNDEILKKTGSAESLLEKYTSDVTVKEPKISKRPFSQVKNFCDNYLCVTDDSKKTASCKKGGPLSVADFIEAHECSPRNGKEFGDKCVLDAKQMLSFLRSLKEKQEEKEKIVNYNMSIAESGKKSSGKEAGYSSFLQNFLGVEATLKAEGKPLTSVTVAEKVREFEEKKLEVIPQSNKEVVLANNENNKVYNMIKNNKQEQDLQQANQSNQQVLQNFAAYNNEEEKKAVIAKSLSKFSAKQTTDNLKKEEQHTGKDRSDELRRIRKELEDVVKNMSGKEEEKLETIADYNSSLIPGKKSPETTKNMSAEERERLESYRANLNNWERRLREREYELNDRDIRGVSRNLASSDVAGTEKRFDKSAPTESFKDNSINNPSVSNANLRLTKNSGNQTTVNNKNDGGQEQSAFTSDGIPLVNAESLATLEKSQLTKLGIGSRDSFIIKVRHQTRIFDVMVKSFSYNGKSMYVPLLNNQNRELSRIILESPLFSDYRQFQNRREQGLE